MSVVRRKIRLGGVLGLALALAACRATAPGVAPVSPAAPPAASAQTSGGVSLTILWPARSAYGLQAIPANANSLRFELLSADESQQLATTLVKRPANGDLVSAVELDEVPAASGLIVRATAYLEQEPGLDPTVVARGRALVDVLPSTRVTVHVTLSAENPPVITSIPANAGPNTFISVTGSNFYGETGIEVTFGGVPSPVVNGFGNALQVYVPANAKDGPVVVTANGISGVSAGSLAIIRALSLSPTTARASMDVPIPFAVAAAREDGAPIPDPNVTSWSYAYLGTGVEDKDRPAPPPSTLTGAGLFTPAATGTYRITVAAGTVQATADLVVD